MPSYDYDRGHHHRDVTTSVPEAQGGPQAIGRSRGGLNTKIHLAAAGLKEVLAFSLTPGQVHDAPPGRELLRSLGLDNIQVPLIMDRAYEGNETRYLAQSLGFEPVVPPLSTRRDPWPYDAEHRRPAAMTSVNTP